MKLYTLILVSIFTSSISLSVSANKLSIPFATGEWEPYVSEKLEDYGFFTELVTATIHEMGAKATYEFYPWKRCFSYVERGKVFAAFPYSVTEERKKVVLYSDPIYTSKTIFFYHKKLKNPPIEYKELKDLSPYSFSGVLGYFYKDLFDNLNFTVSYSNSELTALKLLYHQRVDLYPMNDLVGWSLIKEHYPKDISQFSVLQKPLREHGLHLIISKNYPNSRELLKQFNQALQRIKENGTYNNILSKHHKHI